MNKEARQILAQIVKNESSEVGEKTLQVIFKKLAEAGYETPYNVSGIKLNKQATPLRPQQIHDILEKEVGGDDYEEPDPNKETYFSYADDDVRTPEDDFKDWKRTDGFEFQSPEEQKKIRDEDSETAWNEKEQQDELKKKFDMRNMEFDEEVAHYQSTGDYPDVEKFHPEKYVQQTLTAEDSPRSLPSEVRDYLFGGGTIKIIDSYALENDAFADYSDEYSDEMVRAMPPYTQRVAFNKALAKAYNVYHYAADREHFYAPIGLREAVEAYPNEKVIYVSLEDLS